MTAQLKLRGFADKLAIEMMERARSMGRGELPRWMIKRATELIEVAEAARAEAKSAEKKS